MNAMCDHAMIVVAVVITVLLGYIPNYSQIFFFKLALEEFPQRFQIYLK